MQAAQAEKRELEKLVGEVQAWMQSPRFKHTKRPYAAAQG